MNQILFKKINRKKLKLFHFLFLFSVLFIIIFTIYELFIIMDKKNKELYSKELLNSFNIEQLYSLNSKAYTNVELNKNSNYFIIGSIKIDKINIEYPILSDVSDELLKISVCRFYGPYPNKIGNLCIAGHNYDDNRFFGNLSKLELDDEIKIYDSNNLCFSYYVYNIYETSNTDISCTSQHTNQKREITLVTCNNKNRKRLIVKAKEK